MITLGRAVIPVGDLDDAVAFYAAALRFTVLFDREIFPGFRSVHVGPGGMQDAGVWLMPADGAAGGDEPAMVLYTTDFEADVECLRASGASLVGERGDGADDRDGRSVTVLDPWRNMIVLAEMPHAGVPDPVVLQDGSSTIRAEMSSDGAAIVECFVSAYNSEPWCENWTVDSAIARLGELRHRARAASLVCVIDGVVVGAAFIHARTYQDASEIYIDEFFVRPEAQGKGVGKALVEAVREYARNIGADGLTLLTDDDKPAFEFYRAQGFRVGRTQRFMIG